MKKVLVTYNMFREGFTELEEKYQVTFPAADKDFTYDEVMGMIPAYDALCPMFNFPINQVLIDRAENLKVIANYGVGYNNIDVVYAHSKGLIVANTPSAVTEPTANLALALLIDTARRVTEYDRKWRSLRAGMKVGILENLGTKVTGATLGIIGFGRIGKALCRRALACGMEVVYHDLRRLDAEEETKTGARYATIDELLEKSDFVSLNAPYSPDTYHIIGEEALQKMKPTAILVNTARGPLVDEKALVKALQKGEIAGAGLDVFENNDIPLPELFEMDNVVLTPHVGTQTVYSRIEIAKAVSNNIIGIFEGDRPASIVML